MNKTLLHCTAMVNIPYWINIPYSRAVHLYEILDRLLTFEKQ